MKEALDGKLLISILAGVTIAQISAWVLPSTKVIRAMPNTPCKVRNLGEMGRHRVIDDPSPTTDQGGNDSRQHPAAILHS